MKQRLTALCLVFCLGIGLGLSAAPSDPPYRIETGWLTLSDGVRLAVTYYIPQQTSANSQFPVLLEMLPYRKDDVGKSWAHPLYDFFARKGIALAKVDIRGTGSSEGQTPGREYSPQEIEDAIEVIAQLAKLEFSNGKIGMWGISWGGFNAIQVALRNPPELKAILAAHASDDLYSNDVHFTDGIFGIDEYILSINHMNGFMASPQYSINEDYFTDRFDQTPWLFTTLKTNQDGPFWRGGSLKHQMSQLKIPLFLIGGLLDGYRDTLPNTLSSAEVPVRAVLGPWPHAWPDSATPGPTWEWRDDAAAWWHSWLGDQSEQTSPYDEKSFRVFVRGGNAPNPSLPEIAGDWYQLQWPLPDSEVNHLQLFPSTDSALITTASDLQETTITLSNLPSNGIDLGEWWGELLPNMSATDENALVFDSASVQEEQVVVGIPEVELLAASNSADGNWVVRLEDIAPDGQVTLVTGGAINAQLRRSTLDPMPVSAGEFMALKVPLRMTTWTFKPGHKIRLAISNGAFPMFWPSPKLSASTLTVNSQNTVLNLPLWLGKSESQPLSMDKGTPSNYLGSDEIAIGPAANYPRRRELIENEDNNSVSLVRESGVSYSLGALDITATRHTRHTAFNLEPAATEFHGWAEYVVNKRQDEKPVVYRTEIDLKSDAEFFNLSISRVLSNEDGEIRRRHWQEQIPRGAQ